MGKFFLAKNGIYFKALLSLTLPFSLLCDNAKRKLYKEVLKVLYKSWWNLTLLIAYITIQFNVRQC